MTDPVIVVEDVVTTPEPSKTSTYIKAGALVAVAAIGTFLVYKKFSSTEEVIDTATAVAE